MTFGLSARVYEDLVSVFSSYPAVDRVLIFGSRAKGTARPGSDIDLAVEAPTMSDSAFARLCLELDDLPLVFKLDVIHLDQLQSGPLADKILGEGKLFYPLGVAKPESGYQTSEAR